MALNVKYDSQLTYFFDRNDLKVVIIQRSTRAYSCRGLFHLRNFSVGKKSFLANKIKYRSISINKNIYISPFIIAAVIIIRVAVVFILLHFLWGRNHFLFLHGRLRLLFHFPLFAFSGLQQLGLLQFAQGVGVVVQIQLGKDFLRNVKKTLKSTVNRFCLFKSKCAIHTLLNHMLVSRSLFSSFSSSSTINLFPSPSSCGSLANATLQKCKKQQWIPWKHLFIYSCKKFGQK